MFTPFVPYPENPPDIQERPIGGLRVHWYERMSVVKKAGGAWYVIAEGPHLPNNCSTLRKVYRWAEITMRTSRRTGTVKLYARVRPKPPEEPQPEGRDNDQERSPPHPVAGRPGASAE